MFPTRVAPPVQSPFLSTYVSPRQSYCTPCRNLSTADKMFGVGVTVLSLGAILWSAASSSPEDEAGRNNQIALGQAFTVVGTGLCVPKAIALVDRLIDRYREGRFENIERVHYGVELSENV